MSFLYDTTLLCESFRSLEHSQIKLHCIKVGKLDVCGSLVFSNPVTYVTRSAKINHVGTITDTHFIAQENNYTIIGLCLGSIL